MGSRVAAGKPREKVQAVVTPHPARRVKLQRQTTAELVAEELRTRIITGEIGEGEPLYQERLAAELGVSRIPLREAMRQLEAEGLITLSSHRGGIVSVLSLDEIRELFEIRSCLETWLLGAAIPNLKEADFTALTAIIDSMHDGEIERWGELNWAFHERLYAPAGRKQSMQILQRIHRNLDRYLRLQISITSGWQKANDDHRAIVEACRARDVRRATTLLAVHIMDGADALVNALSKRRSAKRA